METARRWTRRTSMCVVPCVDGSRMCARRFVARLGKLWMNVLRLETCRLALWWHLWRGVCCGSVRSGCSCSWRPTSVRRPSSYRRSSSSGVNDFAHIELLKRMKLFITAAYLRKHSALPEIRSETNVRYLPIPSERSFYFICSSASDYRLYVLWEVRKTHPCSARRFHVCNLQIPSSAVLNLVCFSSLSILIPPTIDSKHILSHLPVQSLLFQCAICSHGGHQACYRRFYGEIPLALLPAPQAPSPGSPMKFLPRHYRSASASRSKDRESDDATDIVAPDDSFDTSTVTPAPRQLMGHPCAAGCGHFCWVANFREDDMPEKP